MEVLEGLVQKAAAQLGLQPSKGQASRYLGVAKSNGKWLARLKGKTLGSFDLEIQAALAVRARQLDAKEASELDHTLEALKQVAPHLLAVTCGCGKQRAECLCKEKSLREAEAARAALEAIRAAAASPAPPVAQLSAPVPERPTEKAPKMKAAKAKASNPSKANAAETAAEKTGSSAEYYRLEKLRRQHALQRRRGKELRRRERRSQLEQRLQKRMEIEAGDEGRIRIVQEPEGVRTEEGARFASLRQLFLARLRRRRKRRPEPDVRAVQLERFGTMRVLSFWDAEDKLKWLAQQKEAREKFDHLIPSTPADHIPSTPVGDLLDMPIQEFNEELEPKVKRSKWRPSSELALKRLVERRKKEAEEATREAEAGEAEVPQETEELKTAGKLESKSKAQRVEWLLLQQMEPQPFLAVALCESERQAQLEEQKQQEAWEEQGGPQEEEQLAREWRQTVRRRRQSFLARRGAHRWFRTSEKAQDKVATDPYL